MNSKLHCKKKMSCFFFFFKVPSSVSRRCGMFSPSSSKCSRRNWVSSVTCSKSGTQVQNVTLRRRHLGSAQDSASLHAYETLFVVGKIAAHKSFKALKERKVTRYLFDLSLLLIQRGAIEVQQRGGDADRKVVGIHLVCVSALQDVVKHTGEMLQEDFVGPRKLVCDPGSKNGEGPCLKRRTKSNPRLARSPPLS